MNIVHDRGALDDYLREHRMENVFPDKLKPHLSLHVFDEGDLICAQGEPAETLYVLVKGKIKIYNNSAEGRTLVISFKTPLEVIGDIEYIGGTEIKNTVEAVSSVVMIGVPYPWMRKYGDDSPSMLRFLLGIMTKKFFYKTDHTSLNLMYPVEVRLASYLLSVSFDETDDGFVGRLPVSSVTDTANLLGTSYRHLNRVIRKLAAEGWIERNKTFIVVKDREALQKLVKAAKGE